MQTTVLPPHTHAHSLSLPRGKIEPIRRDCIILGILFAVLLLIPISSFSLSFTWVVTNSACYNSTGEIDIIITGTPPFSVTADYYGTNVNAYTQTNITTNTWTIAPLISGMYTVTVFDGTNTYSQNVFVDETDYGWPLVPINNLRITPVDVKVDNDKNVIATGWWIGNIEFPGGPLMSAPGNAASDIYLVKYDKCGGFIWQIKVQNINAIPSGCSVMAMCLDLNDDIIICGNCSEGDIEFAGSTITAPGDTKGFVAKFSGNSGAVQWVNFISSFRSVSPRDICVSNDYEIFMFSEFYNADINFYNPNSSTIILTIPPFSIFGPSDNLLSVYNTNGILQNAEINDISFNYEDHAGAIAVYPGLTAGRTEIIMVGSQRSGPATSPAYEFMGRKWEYNSGGGFTFLGNFTLPTPTPFSTIENFMGLSVDVWQNSSNDWLIAIGGFEDNPLSLPPTSNTIPFIGSFITSGNLTPPPTLSYGDYLINQGPFGFPTINYTSAMAFNKNTGELFAGGLATIDGPHPLNYGPPFNTVNVSGSYPDFFIDKFRPSQTTIGPPMWNIASNSGTSTYGNNSNVALCSDQINKAFIHSGFVYNINAPSFSATSAGAGCFIARFFETSTTAGQIHNSPVIDNPLKNVTDVHLYPNPADDALTIEFLPNDVSTLTVDIQSIEGRILKNIAYNGNAMSSISLDIRFLKPGIYLLNIKTSNKVFVKKVVIQ